MKQKRQESPWERRPNEPASAGPWRKQVKHRRVKYFSHLGKQLARLSYKDITGSVPVCCRRYFRVLYVVLQHDLNHGNPGIAFRGLRNVHVRDVNSACIYPCFTFCSMTF